MVICATIALLSLRIHRATAAGQLAPNKFAYMLWSNFAHFTPRDNITIVLKGAHFKNSCVTYWSLTMYRSIRCIRDKSRSGWVEEGVEEVSRAAAQTRYHTERV